MATFARNGILGKEDGWIRQSANPYSVDCVLRILHSLTLAREGGFLLHAASAVRNGKAFLFSGVSGAGKTTIARLAPTDVTLLTDEISYVRWQSGGYIACGTPFAGELARVGENCSAPLAALYFLAKGPENRIDPVSSADAVGLLLRNILFFAEDPDLVKQLFRSVFEFVERVPVQRLTFFPMRAFGTSSGRSAAFDDRKIHCAKLSDCCPLAGGRDDDHVSGRLHLFHAKRSRHCDLAVRRRVYSFE